MKFIGEVSQLKDLGDEAEVTITNVQRNGAADWRDYGKPLEFKMPYSFAEACKIGRRVSIILKVKK